MEKATVKNGSNIFYTHWLMNDVNWDGNKLLPHFKKYIPINNSLKR